MTDLSERVVAVEGKSASAHKRIDEEHVEIIRNRDSIHDLRDTCTDTFIAFRQNYADLKSIALNNNNQITSLIDEHKEMKEAVNNNTKVMTELKGGIKVFVWLVGCFGGIAGVIKLAEMVA